MSTNSLIEWTKHTLNLWWGCTKISPACLFCYAWVLSQFRIPVGWLIFGPRSNRKTRRGARRPVIWGRKAKRIAPPLGGDYMRQPFKWNRDAARLGERHRVFVSSMSDLFEDHPDPRIKRMMSERRTFFFEHIVPACPNLDFLALTKRPHNIMGRVPASWKKGFPPNVWIGCTVEDQQRADERLPYLVEVPAVVRFISAEPLLEAVDLARFIDNIDWVICGGESASKARPSAIEWVRSLRDQTIAAGKKFFFKQWGHWSQRDGSGEQLVKLRVKNTRLLDGREWNELPQPRVGPRNAVAS